jgi:hypothetical protein
LKDVDDLMPFLYILNHTIGKGNPLPVYFLFFGETPNPITGVPDPHTKCILLQENSGPWYNANVALARCEKVNRKTIFLFLLPSPLL